MTTGEVKQVLAPVRRVPGLEGLALVQVQTGEGTLIAADTLGAAPGDRVLLSRDGAARSAFGTNCPADAAVVCVLE